MTQQNNKPNDKPLAGLKVVEIGAAMAGPYCGMMLADYGAEVTKIESIDGGDFARAWPPFFPNKMSHYFAAVNRNKKSITLDLKSEQGIEVAKKLLSEADAMVANFRVGALDRMGLGYEAMAELNPRLVYCNISGFGPTGPRAKQAANDLFMQAYSGGMSMTGEVTGGPCKMAISIADVGAGMFATIGILMAIEQRHRTGCGQRVDTSLLEGQLSMLSYHLTKFFASGEPAGRTGSRGGAGMPYQAFPTADDDIVIATFNDGMYARFCEAIDQPQWAKDDRFAVFEYRRKNSALLEPMLAEVLATKPAKHWLAKMEKYDVPCTPVNRIDQIVVDEQVDVCNMIMDVPSEDFGLMKMAGFPIKFQGRAWEDQTTPPPALGQHSVEVLQQLGYGSDEIKAMLAKHVTSAG